MNRREDKKWKLINEALAAQSSGKSPRLLSSRKTLFGIPSALDQELQAIADDSNSGAKYKNSNEKDTAGASRRNESKTSTHVIHPLKPVFSDHSKVLILGTMPSPKSRETGFYYNHPQNRFWKVIAAIFDEEIPTTNEQKHDLILRNNLALWDVLAECTIEGASDATIAECIPNDISSLLRKAPIEKIYCTGTKAFELFEKYCKPTCAIDAIKLPSTSSANASTSLESLIEKYSVVAKSAKKIN